MRFNPLAHGLALMIPVLIAANGCGDSDLAPTASADRISLQSENGSMQLREPAKESGREADKNVLAQINEAMADQGLNLAVFKVEFITLSGHHMESGNILFASDHTKRLSVQWAPNDPRRNADGNNITYMVDPTKGAANPGISADLTEEAIDRSFQIWETTKCQSMNIVKRPNSGEDATIVDFFLGFGGQGDPFQADIVSAGFMEAPFWDALAPDGSQFILGATFTLAFTDEDDNFTDVNRDRYADTALKEVYYNNAFTWTLGDSEGIDLESIALHENGHALGMGHFGNLFVTRANRKLHTSPYAVMNAAYTGPQRELAGTDKAAYCGIYSTWPSD